MAYEPKPGSFSLFKNDKEGNESRPDYTGEGLNMDGTPIRVSAWIKQGKSGKFMSCNIQPKNKGAVPKPESKPSGSFDDMDSDIPF